MRLLTLIPLLAVLQAAAKATGCDSSGPQQSTSGIAATRVTVPTQPNGLTVEQQNVRDRLGEDNKPGAIKHLYVISAFSGQVLLYSTVRGKVTSSGKRLSPYTVIGNGHEGYTQGFSVPGLNGAETNEVLQDDGTYGSSVDYIYWWDTKGIYHQHYINGGQIVHISSQPLNVPHIVINLNEAR